MAVAVAVQGSSVTYWGNGAALQHLAPVSVGSWVQDNSYARIVSPWNYAYQAPVATVAAAPVAYVEPYTAYQPAVAVVAQKEARYLAANRGAVHEATLPGHTVNQQSLNLEPAPGTLIMKCIAAVVMVALVASAQANAVPYYNAIPSVYSVPATTVVQQNVVPKYVTAYSAPAVTYAHHASVAPVAAYAAPVATYAASPISYAAHNTVVQAPVQAYAAPAAYAYDHTNYVQAVPAVYAQVQKEATYVAATRGAVHKAPLVGHAVNQKSLNVEPAPGTL
uniref:Cuticle protein n=1 Tax=Anopheles christyi TaxID=43041 RepID=A0A182KAJ3_9DIPT